MTDHLSRDSRTFLTKTLAALTIVIGATGAQAQAGPQPTDYALEQFGSPPPTPTGPLAEPVQAALRHLIDKSFD